KQLVAIFVKFSIALGRSDDDRRGMAISGSGERQETVQIPQARTPLFFVVSLAEALDVRKRRLDRPDHEGHRPFAQEESERTRNDRRHRLDAENDIALTRNNAASHLAPGAPFKG